MIYVGSSNFAGWHIAQANEAARRRHFLGLVSEQSLYNLGAAHGRARSAAGLPLPTASASFPWSPLAGGMLGGGRDATEGRRASANPRWEATGAAARALGDLVLGARRRAGCGGAGVAAAPARGRGPIIGPRTVAQLDGASMAALDVMLDEQACKELDEIFPARAVGLPRRTPGSRRPFPSIRNLAAAMADPMRSPVRLPTMGADRFDRGLVLGAFLPPHVGQHSLIRTCRRCAHVMIAVTDRPGQLPETHDRASWMQAIHLDLDVVVLPDKCEWHGAAPCVDECASAWADQVALLPAPFDLLVTAEPYGPVLAERLGATYLDPSTLTRPIWASNRPSARR